MGKCHRVYMKETTWRILFSSPHMSVPQGWWLGPLPKGAILLALPPLFLITTEALGELSMSPWEMAQESGRVCSDKPWPGAAPAETWLCDSRGRLALHLGTHNTLPPLDLTGG